MPSPRTLRDMVTGPGNMPTDGQSISAPPQRAAAGPSAPPAPPAGPSAPPAPPAATIMPSPRTLYNMFTGPGDLPADGQSISAPPRTRPGPRSRHHGRSVSGAHHRRASGGRGLK
jgi:hypothetical protein